MFRSSILVTQLVMAPMLGLSASLARAQVGEPSGITPQRRVAITIDDLPAVATQNGFEVHQELTNRLLAGLARHGVRATGFVNENKLYSADTLDPRRVELLHQWVAAGHELGNHTFSHPSLYNTDLAVFEQDVLLGERVIRPLMEPDGDRLRYFRHPFLNTGPDRETKDAFERFLADHGYRIAPVTIDNQEWIFARAYDRALDAADWPLVGGVENAYIEYMDSIFGYYEQQSRALLGYELSQILLIHANRLNANVFDRLAGMMRERGYQVITLDQALQDSAYGSRDDYVGRAGITWLHRWALTAGKRGTFFHGEPRVPPFINALAGVDPP